MKTLFALLQQDARISDYKINLHQKESSELFFVKGCLETVRRTNTCDKEVTLYVNHNGYKGDARFFIYPSTTDAELKTLIDSAVAKASLIDNRDYQLPAGETGEFQVESNLSQLSLSQLATRIANSVFAANDVENASLNSVEIFVNKHTDTVINSRGIHKTQSRYDVMVETIPTYNGQTQSVELYQQYNFSHLDEKEITRQVRDYLLAAKARYEATQPETVPSCKVILGKLELSQLFSNIAYDLNYRAVYSHANLHKKGELLQKAPTGDLLTLSVAGSLPGNIRSSCFDSDGMSLGAVTLVEGGKVVNYFGDNRFGQYLDEEPTGNLRCLQVAPGSGEDSDFCQGPYLEVISMSGLQVDFYTDYIGGEVRLAYYHDGSTIRPVTGISITGSLQETLNGIRLSKVLGVHDDYSGPEKAILEKMQIF